MVDFSFNNTNHSRSGYCLVSTTGSAKRRLYGSANSTAGDPLTWSGATPAVHADTSRANIRLRFATPFSVSPTNASAFVNGVWSGTLQVLNTATGVVLTVDDGAGHSGASNPFNVAAAQKGAASPAPPADPDAVPRLDASLIQPGGIMAIQWNSVTGRSYTVSRSTGDLTAFVPVATGIAATPPINVYYEAIGDAPQLYYRVDLEP